MKILRVLAILVVLAALFLCVGCQDKNEIQFMPGSIDLKSNPDLNTPESLAVKSSTIYMGMINGNLDPEKEFEVLLDISCESSKQSLEKSKSYFISNTEESRSYFNSNKNPIASFEFSETIYKSQNEAQIYRIQIQKNGNKYYFAQDFLKENGKWKIKGDNLTENFKLKKKILFWYF